MSEGTCKSIEQRLQEVEDRLEIYNLIAMHPLSADGGDPDLVRAIYSKNIRLDRGGVAGFSGVEAFVESVESDEHKEAVAGGLAHLPGLPLVELVSGTIAYATSYISICRYNQGGEARLLPNHGYSNGFSIFRIVVNRWHLAKENRKWCVTERNLYPLDGTPPAQDIIQKAKSILRAS